MNSLHKIQNPSEKSFMMISEEVHSKDFDLSKDISKKDQLQESFLILKMQEQLNEPEISADTIQNKITKLYKAKKSRVISGFIVLNNII